MAPNNRERKRNVKKRSSSRKHCPDTSSESESSSSSFCSCGDCSDCSDCSCYFTESSESSDICESSRKLSCKPSSTKKKNIPKSKKFTKKSKREKTLICQKDEDTDTSEYECYTGACNRKFKKTNKIRGKWRTACRP